jgi:hypothetical protein
MITPVDHVAENRYLDADTAREVAKTSRYVFIDGETPVVSTWNCNNFVEEVRAAQGGDAASAAIRETKIAEIQERQAYRRWKESRS